MKKVYKLLFLTIILNVADSIFYMNMLWYITDNLDNSYYLGIFFSITLIPDMFIFLLGPLIDKFNVKKMLFISVLVQILSLLIFAVFRMHISISVIFVIIFIFMMSSTFSYVIQETLIPKIVEKEKVVFANSIFEFSSRILDSFINSISSIMIASFGILIVFKYNLLVYILSILVLSTLKLNLDKNNINNKEISKKEKYKFKNYKYELKEGLIFLNNNKLLKDIAIIFLIVNFFNAIQAVAYPIYSKNFFSGEIYYGLLLGVKGLSGIVGSISSGYIIKGIKKSNLLGILLLLNGVFWMLAILTKNIFFNLFLFFLGYFFMSIYNIGFNSIFHIVPPKDLLGRINSTVDSLIAFAMPLGSYIAGIIVDNNNIIYTMMILPLCMIFFGGGDIFY
ncbi:MAG: MFS transporter [Helcococcus sp.]|nr:MFS transporter [Helcococcus sp.]